MPALTVGRISVVVILTAHNLWWWGDTSNSKHHKLKSGNALQTIARYSMNRICRINSDIWTNTTPVYSDHIDGWHHHCSAEWRRRPRVCPEAAALRWDRDWVSMDLPVSFQWRAEEEREETGSESEAKSKEEVRDVGLWVSKKDRRDRRTWGDDSCDGGRRMWELLVWDGGRGTGSC